MGGENDQRDEDDGGSEELPDPTLSASASASDEREWLAAEIEARQVADGASLSVGEASLQSSAIQGGAYLAAREVVGIVVRSVGIVVVTRLIGPSSYGIYAAAAAFALVIATGAQMGLEVYLIRQADEPSETLYHQVFSFLLVVSATVAALSIAISLALSHLVRGVAPSQRIFMLLMLSVPINVLWAPAQAKIERSFGYKRMAWLELSGDIVYYVVAVTLAIVGAGGWSLAIGFVVWQTWLLVGSYRLADLRPRWSWSRNTARELIRHGAPYASSGLTNTAKGLINPIVVGRLYGSAGVGYVALALRLIDTLSFAQRATWRLGLVALSKVRAQSDRLVRGIEQGMVLQLLATSVPVLGACILANWLIPFAFGQQWTPMIPVFAWLAVSKITTAPMTVQFAVLYAASRNSVVALGTLINLIANFALSLLFVPLLGLAGFGVAFALGGLSWYPVYRSARRIAPFSLLSSSRFMVGLAPLALFPLVASPFNLLLFAPLAAVCTLRQVRLELLGYIRLVWRGLRRPGQVSR